MYERSRAERLRSRPAPGGNGSRENFTLSCDTVRLIGQATRKKILPGAGHILPPIFKNVAGIHDMCVRDSASAAQCMRLLDVGTRLLDAPLWTIGAPTLTDHPCVIEERSMRWSLKRQASRGVQWVLTGQSRVTTIEVPCAEGHNMLARASADVMHTPLELE